MAALFFLAFVASVLTLCSCEKNFTVTLIATLEVEVKNYNGQGDDIEGQVVIGLFGNTTPVTVLNFQQLCDGWTRHNQKLSFKNSHCHRLVKDMLVQCGDITTGDGTGSISVYSDRFNDENFSISHRSGGIVSMANHGKDTNGSQFFFTLGPSRFLDNKHVAFGKVLKGFILLKAMNRMGPREDRKSPKRPIRLVDCSIQDTKEYELSLKQMSTDDLEEGKK